MADKSEQTRALEDLTRAIQQLNEQAQVLARAARVSHAGGIGQALSGSGGNAIASGASAVSRMTVMRGAGSGAFSTQALRGAGAGGLLSTWTAGGIVALGGMAAGAQLSAMREAALTGSNPFMGDAERQQSLRQNSLASKAERFFGIDREALTGASEALAIRTGSVNETMGAAMNAFNKGVPLSRDEINRLRDISTARNVAKHGVFLDVQDSFSDPGFSDPLTKANWAQAGIWQGRWDLQGQSNTMSSLGTRDLGQAIADLTQWLKENSQVRAQSGVDPRRGAK